MKTKVEELEEKCRLLQDEVTGNLELIKSLMDKIEILEEINRRHDDLFKSVFYELEENNDNTYELLNFIQKSPEIKFKNDVNKILKNKKPGATEIIKKMPESLRNKLRGNKIAIKEYAKEIKYPSLDYFYIAFNKYRPKN